VLEIPEAVVIAEQIGATLAGKTVADAAIGQSPHSFAWYNRPAAQYRELLVGRSVRAARPRGGMIQILTETSRILTSVSPRYFAVGEKRPSKHQMLVDFDDGSSIACTVQMWGEMLCNREDEPEESRCSASFDKPSPLSREFDEAYFASLMSSADLTALSAKAFLATEQRIPGLGNGVLQDILWTSRISPKRKMASLSDAELTAILASTKSVLVDMAAKGGRDTERDLFGNPGGYATVLSKNTVGKPCPACGTTIQKAAYLGGSIYFCNTCQKP
jgi:formamidopyrimidine-DNA glycosylase